MPTSGITNILKMADPQGCTEQFGWKKLKQSKSLEFFKNMKTKIFILLPLILLIRGSRGNSVQIFSATQAQASQPYG